MPCLNSRRFCKKFALPFGLFGAVSVGIPDQGGCISRGLECQSKIKPKRLKTIFILSKREKRMQRKKVTEFFEYRRQADGVAKQKQMT